MTSATWVAPTVEDNSGVLTLTSSLSPGDEVPIGDTQVVYTATDAAGNSATHTFTITVIGK